MHDIWNPWHGCKKISEGCQNCYMYYLDKARADKSGKEIYKVKANFDYPLHKNRQGRYKIQSGEMIRICMTSDFFLEEADAWRDDVWKIIKERSDVKFFILTKRANRIKDNLPKDWNDGYENVLLNVTCENQKRADERIPILLDIPAKHKGIMVAPMISNIEIDKYLSTGQIEQVLCGGENYDGNRICRFEWVQNLSNQCKKYNVTFNFIETGTRFVKDNKLYVIPSKKVQSEMAYKSGVSFKGKEIDFKLYNIFGKEIKKEDVYVPKFGENCTKCASKLTCNGCTNCKKCVMN